MRIITYKNAINKESFKGLEEFLFFDNLENIEDLEYYLDIRFYDFIIINLSSIKHYTEILQTLKIINSKYINEVKFKLIFTGISDKVIFNNISNYINKLYKNIKFLTIEDNTNIIHELNKDFIKNEYRFKFLNSRKNIDNILLIDHEHGSEKIIQTRKGRDTRILIYFLRHYKEVINIDTLLSAVTEEPELTNASVIESSISRLRKSLKNLFNDKKIYVKKGDGYCLN